MDWEALFNEAASEDEGAAAAPAAVAAAAAPTVYAPFDWEALFRETASEDAVPPAATAPTDGTSMVDEMRAVIEEVMLADAASHAGGDEASASSSDAEARRRQRRRTARPAAAVGAAAPPRPPSPLPGAEAVTPAVAMAAAAAAEPAPFDVDVRGIGELYQRYPYLREELPPPPLAAARGGRHAAAGGGGASAERPDTDPFAVEAFREYLQRLPLPRFAVLPRSREDPTEPPADQGALTTALRAAYADQRLETPALTATYEALLLGESGEFPLRFRTGGVRRVTFPPCANGAHCIGRRGGEMQRRLCLYEGLQGFPPDHPGVVLTALVFPAEFATLLQTGRAPTQQRPCVLCYRITLADAIYTLRWNRAGGKGDGDETAAAEAEAPRVLQLYHNPSNCEDGYLRSCMLQQHETVFDGLVDAVAEFRYTMLRAFRHADQGQRWCIDQSQMLYRSPEPPRVLAPERGAHGLSHF